MSPSPSLTNHSIASHTGTSKSKKSGSCKTGSLSNISSILAHKKAKAEAAKAKAEFAIKAAGIKKQQAILLEQQQLHAAQSARRQAELKADLECLEIQGDAAQTLAEAKVFQSIENGSVNDNLTDFSFPCEDPQNRTEQFVEQYCTIDQIDETEQSDSKCMQKDSIEQDHQPRLTDPVVNCSYTPRLHNSEHSPRETRVKMQTDCRPTDFATYNVSTPMNAQAPSYRPQADTIPACISQNPSSQVTQEITNFLLKKELLLTRLSPFNDQAETYISWRSGFLSVVRETGVTAAEELDLLIRWLGPASVKHAHSLKAANPFNPSRALYLLWERLDERFGAPEMVESSLKSKLEQFPKLTNKDTPQLYELVDILTQIESLKEDSQFMTLLAYYDSSSGILPIVRKLTYSLQEKWTSRAADYKRRFGVPFPPFSFFVSFIREMSRVKNDPCFVYETPVVLPSKKPETPKPGNQRLNVSSKKTDVTVNGQKMDQPMSKCPLHNSKHTLNDCRVFRNKGIEERKELLRRHKLCFRCCLSNKHTANMCKEIISCEVCKSDRHTTALHVNYSTDPGAMPQASPELTKHDPAPSVSSTCTQVCGGQFNGKSCSKTVLVNVYPKGEPHRSKRLYAIVDEQSNATLARSEFFDLFREHGQGKPYKLNSCNGCMSTYGRVAQDYVVASLDNSCHVDISTVTECDLIPDNRAEIPTPEVAYAHAHLSTIAKFIPPIDNTAKILLLIGRDTPDSHHVLNQITGPRNAPYAQQLPLGWVVIGETCLGETHTPDYTVNKIYVVNNGRPSLFTPCDRKLHVKAAEPFNKAVVNIPLDVDLDSDIFHTTNDDHKKGPSMEDRTFIEVMENNMYRDVDGNWTAPLPFGTTRQRLPNNRGKALKRARTLHYSLIRSAVKKEHFFEFMKKILDSGHAEVAPDLQPDQECWYLPLFGVYHPQKPDQIRGVFDSSVGRGCFRVCLNKHNF